MASFTVKDVKELRDKTGVSMMECKKALTEADGDLEKAMKYLREQGLAAAAKKAERIAAEGLVYAVVDEDKKVGAIVEVNSETDFVAKNTDFQAFVRKLAEIIINENPADVDVLLKLKYSDDMTVEEELRDKILVIGENLNIRRFVRLEGDVIPYVHGDGKIGVLVQFKADESVSGSDALGEAGKDVAMQIAALAPLYLDRTSIPEETVAEEKRVLIANIENDPKMSNKPANIIEKMVEGRLGKYFEDISLMDQAFVKDGSMKVKKYIEGVAKEAGGDMKVIHFIRFEKGEGIEKRSEDFASEVASMI